jgi:hypothetical protein
LLSVGKSGGDRFGIDINGPGSGDKLFEIHNNGNTFWSKNVGPNSETYDVQLRMSDTTAELKYRIHGTTDWSTSGAVAITHPLSYWNEVVLYGRAGGGTGAFDTLQLVSTAAPEPTSITLLASGLLGLLAYAWRKRK